MQASSAEIFGSPVDSPQDESTPIAPTNPYGAAKASAHLAVAEARARGLHAASAILYNHESPRRPDDVRHPQDHPRRSRRSPAARPTSWCSATSTPAATGAGPRTTSTRWCAPPGTRPPEDYVVATGESTRSREFVAAAFAAAGVADWEPYVRVDPAFVRPTDAAEQVGDAGQARRELGWAPTKRFPEIVAAMVAADLAPGG